MDPSSFLEFLVEYLPSLGEVPDGGALFVEWPEECRYYVCLSMEQEQW